MTAYQSTPLSSFSGIRSGLFNAYAQGKTRDITFRKQQLLQLAYMFQDNKDRLWEVLAADLGRNFNETEYLEYVAIANHAMRAYENVEKWAKPDSPAFSLNTFPMSPRTLKQPKGVVLIIGPFNYPIFCVAVPLIGAIAAGCAVYLDPSLYTVVNGGVPETTALLDLRWEHIFFTGGTRVGKIVAAAAAKHLTPLGGKNPTIVDKDCDFDASARKILWGKLVNAGQTCTAPDYIMVVPEAHDKLVAAFTKAHKQFFPDANSEAKEMTRIINAASFTRLSDMLERTSGKIVIGGKRDPSNNWLSTTIVDKCSFDDSLMKEELFGPLLPIVTVASIEEAVSHVAAGEHPIGCYIFSKNKKVIDYVYKNTISGSVVVNDTVLQAGIYGIAFGGIGSSGYGSNGGKYAFDTFTQLRGSLQFPFWLENIMSHRYPPYTVEKLEQIDKALLKSIPYPRPGSRQTTTWDKLAAAATLAAVCGILFDFLAKHK
ncbi:aldehyde dehydrogenase [Exidia glandulosa HHB12029]|uniref:Aldehyde dehydrogenase n=1 Tax=Exidia glandulosa HHB12029 TaxID=1314781 RepID=A0A165GL89_EXIGL|nr:aldehyde dehydrogenase [Exidia glandulosa HHB12029]